MKKYLPNILSFLRIPLSIAMFGCMKRPIILVAVYILCGITDILDGFFARRFHVVSPLGAKIDGFADIVFYGTAIIIALLNLSFDTPFIVIIAFVATIRVFNIGLTKGTFRQWGGLHTIGNKAAGAALFVLWPVCVYLGHVPDWAAITAGLITFISALEETVLLFSCKTYNPDIKSVFSRTSPNQIKPE